MLFDYLIFKMGRNPGVNEGLGDLVPDIVNRLNSKKTVVLRGYDERRDCWFIDRVGEEFGGSLKTKRFGNFDLSSLNGRSQLVLDPNKDSDVIEEDAYVVTLKYFRSNPAYTSHR